MGCGCGGGKKSASFRRPIQGTNRLIRPSVGPLSIQGGPAAGATPGELRALGLQTNTSPKTAAHMNADKLRIQKLRREAVRNALNK